eukprot:CAMPEP_0171059480 /NCGR_PEP_ID=MMETSP0766_2-20121228/3201_1 /TAXON_ID=439317 /ORGANISM="Gambierdiscus australes, Strain CAWD 149" /LENGTH=80 /DNA_ID=CAMNT_0011514919 /DNA_START=408 /DNA_END=647 /DNA_ORIENTATION=+
MRMAAADVALNSGRSCHSSLAKAQEVLEMPCAPKSVILLRAADDIDARKGASRTSSRENDHAEFEISCSVNSVIVLSAAD